MQNVALNRILKVRAMGTNKPARIGRRLDELRRHRIAGRPQLHRPFVDREGGAQDGGGGVGRVLVGADGFYDGLRARFIVAVQYMRQGILPGRCRCGMQDIAAGLDDVMHRGRLDLPLLVTAGARQPSKKLAQVIIGDDRAAPGLARHEVSVADCGVHGISAEAGQRARLRDAVRAAASLGGVLRHLCRPASGAVRVTADAGSFVDSASGYSGGEIPTFVSSTLQISNATTSWSSLSASPSI